MIIAEAVPENVTQLILGLSMLGNFFLLFGKIFGRTEKREITPQPLEVRKNPEYVSVERYQKNCDINYRDHRDLDAKIERTCKEILAAGQHREDRLTRRIEEIADGLGKLIGNVEMLVANKK